MSNPANLPGVDGRMAAVFATVFPGYDDAQIRNTTQAGIEEWDSVAAISLVNVIEEEFGIELDFEEAVQLQSFRAVADYVAGKLPG